MDRLTENEMLMARINTLERRVEQLENWTGADEDGNWLDEQTSVQDALSAQGMIVTTLLRFLEATIPAFSIVEFREYLHRNAGFIERSQDRSAMEMTSDDPEAMKAKWRRVTDDLLPASRYEPRPAPREHLTLVEASPSDDDTPPANA